MIEVSVSQQDNLIISFEVSGHANSGPYGFDLVCAAVSAVTFGATNALEVIGGFEPLVEQGGEGGYLSVTIPQAFVENNEIQTILKTMIISLQSIARDYGQFIQIKGM